MKNKFFFSAMLVSLLAFGFSFISCGPSAAEIAMRSAPSVEDVPGLRNKLTWLESNAKSGGNYIIEISADEIVDISEKFSELFTESSSRKGYLSYGGRKNITITLRGVGANRTIFRSSYGFKVGYGVTLVLDDNITIQGTGREPSSTPLVIVSYGGTLVMNDGSTITGGISNKDGGINEYGFSNEADGGGGINVSSGGTFIMNGGTITGNICSPIHYVIRNTAKSKKEGGGITAKKEQELKPCSGGGVMVSGGTFIMKGGIITDNIAHHGIPIDPRYGASTDPRNEGGYGGGVYVARGTFTKTGGTITGYDRNLKKGNAVVDYYGNITNNNGHAVYFHGSGESKSMDKTIGPEESFGEVPKEEPESEKNTDEPEDNLSSDGSETSTSPSITPAKGTCETELNRAKIIADRCKKIGKGKSGYDECAEEYKTQITEAQQVCRAR